MQRHGLQTLQGGNMTIQEALDAIKNNKQIEQTNGHEHAEWLPIDHDCFLIYISRGISMGYFRIKPEVIYRRFRCAEELIACGKLFIKKKGIRFEHHLITYITDSHIATLTDKYIDYETAFNLWLFFDGTPFGVKE